MVRARACSELLLVFHLGWASCELSDGPLLGTAPSLTGLGVPRRAGRAWGTQVRWGPCALPLVLRRGPGQSTHPRRSLPIPKRGAPRRGRGRGRSGGASENRSRKSGASHRGQALRTMARLNPSLALGLALLASCLLALPRDARASPRDRLVGGVTDLKPNDPQVQKAAQAAVASYNMGSNSLYYFRDTRILKAQSQVRLGWRDGAVRRAAGRQVTEESRE